MSESSRLSTLPGKHLAEGSFRTLAQGAADEVVIWKNNHGRTVKITGVGVVPEDTVIGDNANNFALQLRNKGTDGTGTIGITAVKDYVTGTDMSAFAEDVLTLSATEDDLLVADGEVVALNKTENGSGLALPPGLVSLQYQFV